MMSGAGFADHEVNQWLTNQRNGLYFVNSDRLDKGLFPIGVPVLEAPEREVGFVEAARLGFAGSNTGLRLQLGGVDVEGDNAPSQAQQKEMPRLRNVVLRVPWPRGPRMAAWAVPWVQWRARGVGHFGGEMPGLWRARG